MVFWGMGKVKACDAYSGILWKQEGLLEGVIQCEEFTKFLMELVQKFP